LSLGFQITLLNTIDFRICRSYFSQSHSPLVAAEMEKSVLVAVTNEKVCNFHFVKTSLKIIQEISLRMQTMVLLFENPRFMKMYTNNIIHGNHPYYDDTFLVLHKLLPRAYEYSTHCEFYWLSGDKFENRVKLDWPPPFQEDDTNIYIVGSSIDGILCLK